mgnify:CR=1 FL=1
MLVETKAKVGVFAIALGAYLPQFPTLVPEFEAQYDAFKKTIPDTVEMIDGGIVTTKELSMEAGDKFRAADVDLVILQLLTYATSYNMLPAVRDLNVPVVLVNVQKRKAPDYANTDTPKWLGELYACGAVGEMVADLERAGKRHAVITGVVEGGDAYVAKEIDEWCRAAQVRRRFRYTNIAQIGRPYPGMMDLYIDETNLYNRMGLYTKQFDWEKMWAIADPVTDEDAIRAKAEEILDTFDIEGGATVETVWDMAKYVVAFEEWVKKLPVVPFNYNDSYLYLLESQFNRIEDNCNNEMLLDVLYLYKKCIDDVSDIEYDYLIHGDLNSRNILVQDDEKMKVIDLSPIIGCIELELVRYIEDELFSNIEKFDNIIEFIIEKNDNNIFDKNRLLKLLSVDSFYRTFDSYFIGDTTEIIGKGILLSKKIFNWRCKHGFCFISKRN